MAKMVFYRPTLFAMLFIGLKRKFQTKISFVPNKRRGFTLMLYIDP